MRKYVIYLFFLLTATAAFGQQTPEEYRLQQEQMRRMDQIRQIDSGVYYMDIGQYTAADAKFKEVLATIKGVPSDLAFYFGKNSYFLQQYKQSIDWLTKYIQLKGTNGQFSAEAAEWLRKSEAGLLAQKKEEADKASQVLSSNYEIDCGPSGKVICPVCKGDHVIIKKGFLGDEYRTCPYCSEHGLLTCEEYNLLLKGELKPKF